MAALLTIYLHSLGLRQLAINNPSILRRIFVCLYCCSNWRIAGYVTATTRAKTDKKTCKMGGPFVASCLRLSYAFIIIGMLLLSVNTAISDCLIPEKLKGIEESSELKVSVTKDNVYLTAGSNVYKLNNPEPIDTLENGNFHNIYKTKSGLFLVTDKHLRVSTSSNQMETITGIPHVDSLINIYDVKDYGTLLNFSEGLYFYDENNFTSKLLPSGEDRIVDACIANEDGFVAAIGNQVFSLTKDNNNVKLIPITGFTGLCNDLKSTQKGLILSSYNDGFYKYNMTSKQFEILSLPSDSLGATAGGIISVNGHVLLTTTSALYRIIGDGQIELIENVGSLKYAYARPKNIILHSLKGLFIWDGQQGVQAIPGFQSELLHTFNSNKAVFVQKDQELYSIENQIPEKISVDSSLLAEIDGSFKVISTLDSKTGTLFSTNVGVLHLASGSKQLKRLPGSPETAIELLFINNQENYATTRNQLFKIVNNPPLNKDVFTDIVWPEPTNHVDKPLVVQFDLNTQNYPCASNEAWFEHWVELSLNGKESEKLITPSSPMLDSDEKNRSYKTIVNTEKLGILSISDSQQIYQMAIAGKTFLGQSVRVPFQERIIVGKTLFEHLSDLYEIMYDKKGVIVSFVIFLQLILARYFEWSFNFCFNLFCGTPVEKINKWTRPLLRLPFYRRWIFRRYFDSIRKKLGKKIKNTSELAINFKKNNGSSDNIVQLDDLLSLLQVNRGNIWINGNSSLFSPALSDTLKKKLFFDKAYVKLWREHPFIPIFISGKGSTLNGEQSWVVDQAEEELVKAKLNFKDSGFFKTILESGEFVIIIEGLNDANMELQNAIIHYSHEARSVRFLVISNVSKVKDDVADQFDIFCPVS